MIVDSQARAARLDAGAAAPRAGRPANSSPSGPWTQQMTRAVGVSPRSHGITAKVARSGTRYISLSAMRVKPSIDEPSNHLPWSMASSNCSTGMVTLLTAPTTSVNCRSMKRVPAASDCASTSSAMSAGVARVATSLQTPSGPDVPWGGAPKPRGTQWMVHGDPTARFVRRAQGGGGDPVRRRPKRRRIRSRVRPWETVPVGAPRPAGRRTPVRSPPTPAPAGRRRAARCRRDDGAG